MEASNQRSAAFLAAIVASARDAIVSSNEHEVITTWNPAAEQLFGYTAAEAIGQSFALIMSPGNEAERRDFLARVRGRGTSQRIETTRRRKDGVLIDVETTVGTIREPGGRFLGYVSITRDIRERKAAEAERSATHQNTREVLERITDGFIALDRAWRLTYINQAAGRLLPRNRAAYVGTNFWDEFPMIRGTTVAAAIERAVTDGVTTSCAFYYAPFDAWYESRVYPSPGGVSIFFHDVTEQRQAEEAAAAALQQLQQANRELERLSAAKSDFVTTISHEFRTPLTSIQGFSELIVTEAESLPEAQAFAQTINQNALRLARMVGDVLDLDALETGHREQRRDLVDLNLLVVRVLAAMQSMVAEHRVLTELTSALPLICGDADLLERVITNLVANAIKYSPAGSAITVTTTTTERGEVALTVADHGLGVPDEHRETIFSRYGRIARPEQIGIQGTGLGLPIVRHVVETHRGRVWVEDNIPRGSVFHVVLPAAEPG